MPYRRLPNTDQARVRALRAAVLKANDNFNNEQVLSYKLTLDAENFLRSFERQILLYNQALRNQVDSNKHYHLVLNNIRTYISHFIQVFNLSVIRGEIKKEHKVQYGLNPDIHNVPDLSTEQAIFKCGKQIIQAENERVRQGGVPIYNPTIAKVQIHFEVFKEHKSNQKLYQATTNRYLEELAKMRIIGDQIIIQIWNRVEEHYANETPYNRLVKCESYGLKYYYRKGEKKLLPED